MMSQMVNHCSIEGRLLALCFKQQKKMPANCSWLTEELLECMKQSVGPFTKP